MSTECYAMVRGSAIRVTGLTTRGAVPEPAPYVVSRSVSQVTITEVSDGGGNETLRNDEDELRLHFVQNAETIKFTADIKFTKCDPAILNLVCAAPVVENYAGDIVGFDANTRVPAASFAMELWSRVAGNDCGGITEYVTRPFGTGLFGAGRFAVIPSSGPPVRHWGYTLFPFFKGGFLSGFVFENGLVSFTIKNAVVQRGSKWGIGPYPLLEDGTRLFEPVSGNTQFRSVLIPAQPPEPTNGVAYLSDIIDGGTAGSTSSDIVDGGDADSTSSDIIDGGTAA